MRLLKTGIILAFIFSVVLVSSCAGTQGNSNLSTSDTSSPGNQNAANTAKDNIEELGVLVNLPFESEEATWKEEPEKGRKLTAVLRFTAEDTRKIVAGLETYTPAEPVNISAERWFPADLIAQSEMNGDNLLQGNSYSAQDFYRPPYSEGKVTKIENSDYLILELFSK
ncbi:MAG: hypothetical protein WKF92_00125 [Pyrinomonadaceae bacterium]